MFNPSQSDVRNFFFDVFSKAQQKSALSDLEKIAYSVILEHPEYHEILSNKEKYLDFQYTPEMGQTNPFLHLSMHLAIHEQLSIDQPPGIRDLYKQMCHKFGDEHKASHEVIDCLGEMIHHAQRNHVAPDANVYFECINKKLNLGTN
ncbi:MAG: hypothetical protein K0R14_1514 [Burkholderiales bacterium]|jgi:hypothetical protein|nr:hypothetical protein [Burkholderiales bacterium]